jgi:hypothetical protein
MDLEMETKFTRLLAACRYNPARKYLSRTLQEVWGKGRIRKPPSERICKPGY